MLQQDITEIGHAQDPWALFSDRSVAYLDKIW
jgi:hypothetical protein